MTNSRSRFLWNAAGLYLDNVASYFFALITVPYLLRVLGPASYGLFAFCQGLVAYFSASVDFGFNLSATRLVAAHREDPHTLSQMVWNVLGARIMLLAFVTPLAWGLAHTVPQIKSALVLFTVLYGTVLATALGSSWLYQGLEHTDLLSGTNFFVNAASVAAIFILVRGPEDVLTYAFIVTLVPLLGNIAALVLAQIRFHLGVRVPQPAAMLRLLRDGFLLFLSQFGSVVYTAGNSFLLGLLAPPQSVGYFAAAEKLVRLLLRLISPLSAAFYPQMVQAAGRSVPELLQKARKPLLVMGVWGLSLATAAFLGSTAFVRLVLGQAFLPAVPVLQILSLFPVLSAASHVFGVHLLLPLKRDLLFSAILLGGGLVNVLAALVLVPAYQEVGMAAAAVAAELFVATGMVAGVVRVAGSNVRWLWNKQP